MERTILVLFKLNKNYVTINALESINNTFQIIFQKSRISFNVLVSESQSAINDIEKIVKGKINSIICCFENPNDFYTDIFNLDQKLNTQSFSYLDLKQLQNQISYSQTSDFLLTTKILEASYVDNNHNLQSFSNFETLQNKQITSIHAILRRSFIKNEAYKRANNLFSKLNLKVEKYLFSSEACSVYVAKNSQAKNTLTINIRDEAVELSMIKNQNLYDFKNLNFGLKDLIVTVSKEFDIPKNIACYLIASYEKLKNNFQLPLVFRKPFVFDNLDKLITNFLKNIYYEIDMFLKVNNVFENSEVNFVFYENTLINSNTLSNKITNELNNNSILHTNKHLTLNNDLDFVTSAIIDYLCFNIHDQDITDTFIINTKNLENVKIKKNTIKNVFKRIFLT